MPMWTRVWTRFSRVWLAADREGCPRSAQAILAARDNEELLWRKRGERAGDAYRDVGEPTFLIRRGGSDLVSVKGDHDTLPGLEALSADLHGRPTWAAVAAEEYRRGAWPDDRRANGPIATRTVAVPARDEGRCDDTSDPDQGDRDSYALWLSQSFLQTDDECRSCLAQRNVASLPGERTR